MADTSYDTSRHPVLVLNPNSSHDMTAALQKLVLENGCGEHLKLSFFTASSGPPSISNDQDGMESLKHCLPDLTDELLSRYDGFIVACYSDHSLVRWLQQAPVLGKNNKPVIGIMQASLVRSLAIVDNDGRFGIVTTSNEWQQVLESYVQYWLLTEQEEGRLGVVESTGLTARQLHDEPFDDVSSRLKDATKRVLRKGNIEAICLGCAGMAGMDQIVRQACEEELGRDAAGRIHIVDGLLAAIEWMKLEFQVK